jgi:hypothetical protein
MGRAAERHHNTRCLVTFFRDLVYFFRNRAKCRADAILTEWSRS